MRVYSMFAGIGGIDLGLESLGWETVAFSEFDPKIAKKNGRQYAREVMAARFPDAVDCGDITELEFLPSNDGAYIGHLGEEIPVVHDDVEGTMRKRTKLYEGPIQIVAGGFPCQDISSAGKQAGIDGERSGLWRYQFAAIKGLRPKGVLIENVAALAGRGLDRVLKGLASIGYDAEWDVISAAGVGAPHLRERIFIIAWPHGEGHHGEWTTPPVYDCWLEEPDAPRLVTTGQDRPAKLRCLGNAVVPQVAAHVGALLRERITGDHAQDDPDRWDSRHKRGEARGGTKWIGTIDLAAGTDNVPEKLPRAGRMTASPNGEIAWLAERERSCPQKHAKAIALEHLAPTLRPVPGDHPELPHTGLVPTPNASVANYGEGADTWIERKLHHASKEENATRASMPLSIYAQVKLVPTPTAKDADSSRSISAVRDKLPARESQMGETLTDFVDPTNGGRLLPTPCAADANGSRASKGADRPNEGGLLHHAKLLPTPRVYDAESRGSGYTPAEVTGATGASLSSEMHERAKLLPTPTTQDAKNNGSASQMGRKTLPLNAAAKLLPTPRASENENRQTKRTPSQEAGTHGLSLGAEVGSMTPEGAGRLNPTWVCGVMGFPLWWVDLP